MSTQRIVKKHTHRRLCDTFGWHWSKHTSLALVILLSFNIPAGDAGRTLLDWALQADASAMWIALEVAKHRLQTRAVKGLLTQQDALCLLLQGTGLTFTIVKASQDAPGQHAYLIVPEDLVHPDGERVGDNYQQVCPKPEGFGPAFIQVPVADWRT